MTYHQASASGIPDPHPVGAERLSTTTADVFFNGIGVHHG